MDSAARLKILHEKCADPFNVHKKKVTKSLRKVTNKQLQKCIFLNPRDVLCISCLKRVSQFESSTDESDENSGDGNSDIEQASTSDTHQLEHYEEEYVLESVNKSLVDVFEESPVAKKKMKLSSRYGREKVEKTIRSVSRKLQVLSPHNISSDEKSASAKDLDGEEMIAQLEEKFNVCKTKSDQVQVLTVLPKSWSIAKTRMKFVNASDYMVRKAKNLVKEKGILSTPNPRIGHFPEVSVSFLHPCGPSPSFTYPRCTDILSIQSTDVLTLVDVSTSTGRTYTLSTKEMDEASRCLREKL